MGNFLQEKVEPSLIPFCVLDVHSLEMTCLGVSPLAIVGPWLTFITFQGMEEPESFGELVQELIQDPRGFDYLLSEKRSECEPLLRTLADSYSCFMRQEDPLNSR
jgi:hypothetical protein